MDKSVPVLYIAKWRKKPKSSKLNELGFTTIYQLEGGILKWRLQVSKPSNKKIGLSSPEYDKLFDKKV
jgi:hypothetical protein